MVAEVQMADVVGTDQVRSVVSKGDEQKPEEAFITVVTCDLFVQPEHVFVLWTVTCMTGRDSFAGLLFCELTIFT